MLIRTLAVLTTMFITSSLAAAPAAEEKPMADATFNFATRLYQLHAAAGNDAPNFVFSPLSIHMALSMTSAGAGGQTLAQMQKTLGLDAAAFQSPADAHAAYGLLTDRLLDQTPPRPTDAPPPFVFSLSNNLWLQAGYPIEPAFAKTLHDDYRSDPTPLDFATAPDAARLKINDAIAKQTNDKIKDLLGPGTVDALTRLVLTNAVYLKAAWADAFEALNTKPAEFHLRDGGVEKEVPLMSTVRKLPFFENDQIKIVEIPYVGHQLSMLLVLSKDANSARSLDIEKQLADLPSWAAQTSPYEVTLKVPKFKIESSLNLVADLQKLGITDAFSNEADFSGITTHEKLAIGAVVHKAFIDVNEDGTEAAAATAVGITAMAMPIREQPKTAEFIADRPFLFAIRHNQTGVILFLGRVTKP